MRQNVDEFITNLSASGKELYGVNIDKQEDKKTENNNKCCKKAIINTEKNEAKRKKIRMIDKIAKFAHCDWKIIQSFDCF